MFLKNESDEMFLNRSMCTVYVDLCGCLLQNSQQALHVVDRWYFGRVTRVTRIQGWVKFYSWWSAVTRDREHVLCFFSSCSPTTSALLKEQLFCCSCLDIHPHGYSCSCIFIPWNGISHKYLSKKLMASSENYIFNHLQQIVPRPFILELYLILWGL